MTDLSLKYWNELAHQLLLITSLLSGFSIAVVANLLVFKSEKRITTIILKTATIASGCFLITVFAMTKIIMMTTEGYPFSITVNDLSLAKTIGAITLLLGIVSLAGVISLSGWIKSRNTGIFTTIVGFLTLLGIAFMLIN